MLENNEDRGILTQDDLDSLYLEMCMSSYRPLAAVLSWLLLYVAYFPEVQDKVYDHTHWVQTKRHRLWFSTKTV